MLNVLQNKAEQIFVYKTVGEREIELLFYPPTVRNYDRAPLLVLIPGGGWCKSYAKSMYDMARSLADGLLEKGFAVAALSYRNHEADGVMMPEIVTDIFDGMSYLAKHSEEFQIDPQNIFSCGHSAGGHLALLLAYAPCDFGEKRIHKAPFKVRATVPISPPTVMSKNQDQLSRYAIGVSYLFSGCDESAFDLYSPLYWVEQGCGVPTLTAVGDCDTLVTPENSYDLCDSLKKHNIPTKILISSGGGHCLEPTKENQSVSITLQNALDAMVDFIVEHNSK